MRQPPTFHRLNLRAPPKPWPRSQSSTPWQLQQLCGSWWELRQREWRGVLSKWPVLQPGEELGIAHRNTYLIGML
jgi:hypothetical protein